MKKIILTLAILISTITYSQKAIEINGTIKVYNRLPKVWNNTINFRNANETQLYNLGFRDVVQPTLSIYQRRGVIYLDSINDVYTYTIIDFTQEEIDNYDQSQLDSDTSAQFFQNRKYEGQLIIDRFSAYIYRKHVIDGVPISQIVFALEFFYEAIQPLKDGYFELSIKRLTALESTNQQIIDMKALIISEINKHL
jgi:hypothetical protein